jgi:hypothetical protein
MTAAGKAARAASNLKKYDWGNLAGTNEGEIKDDYNTEYLFDSGLGSLIPGLGSSWNPVKWDSVGSGDDNYKAVDNVAKKLAGSGLKVAGEVLKPLSNADSVYGQSLSSGVAGGEEGFREALAFEQRTMAFDKFARDTYRQKAREAKSAGVDMVPYDQYAKDLYKGFELTRTNDQGLPVFGSTKVPTQDEVSAKMVKLPDGVKQKVDQAKARLESGQGSMPDIKTMEEALGNGAWLYYMN